MSLKDWIIPGRDLIRPHERFLEFCKRQVCGISELVGSSDDPDDRMLDPAPLIESDLVCSRMKDSDMHIPVLDLDLDAMLIPSSTPGHHHLYIDKPMTWEQYVKLLDVLAEVGILERGYVNVSKKRRMTQVRTPWTKK